MVAKCPVCGAPMQDDTCGYCGHSEKKTAEPTAYATNVSQQPIQPQVVQPQIVINNPPQNNMGFILESVGRTKQLPCFYVFS